MKDAFTIEICGTLPTVEDLRQILQSNKVVTLKYLSLPDGYMLKLVYSLLCYCVYNKEWDKTIIISPSMDNEKILQKKVELCECAKSFREDANYLMNLMANTFGIDLQTLDGLYELKYKKSQKQRGKLNEEWSYHLHGAECRFESKETGQVVEVI